MKAKACTLDFIEKSRKVHGAKYDYSKVRIESKKDFAVIVCKNHGEFSQRAHSHQQGYGCPACGSLTASKKLQGRASPKKKTAKEWLAEIAEYHSSYDLSKAKFVGLDTPIKIRCTKHDHWFEQKPFNVVYFRRKGPRGLGCPKCLTEHKLGVKKFTNSEFQVRLDTRFDDLTVKSYKGMQEPVKVACPKHGTFTANRAQDLYLYGRGCPKCNPPAEGYLEKILHKSFPKAIKNDRRFGYEFDLYWPKRKLAVEVDGVYWHSTKFKAKTYHIDKTEKARTEGIRVLHFWGTEVQANRDLVLSMIQAKLGDLENRVGARQLTVSVIDDKAVVREFFNANHLQGNCGNTLAVGLWKDNTLMACASFAKPRFSKDHEWELIRFAVKKTWSIPGACSRLVKAFERAVKPKSLISYANLRFSTGKVYRSLGFDFVRQTPPNYWWYVPRVGILSRYQTQKHKLEAFLPKFNPALSERDNMLNSRAHQLFDCGNLVYEKTFDARAKRQARRY